MNNSDELMAFLKAMDQADREYLFEKIREKYCIYCGKDDPTYKCYCHATGEDV